MNRLDKRAKLAIMDKMSECGGEMSTEEVMDLVRPYYIFDPHLAKEREIRRKANQIMAQFRDENGIRKCFNYKDVNGGSVYVNVDETKSATALKCVKAQLNSKYNGLNKSKQKITRRQLELIGQMDLFDKENIQ